MALTVAQTADAGAPQAGLTITGLSVVTSCNIVITVSWDGGLTYNPVRGGILTGILGSTFVRDYVTPLNVEATYQAVVTGGTTATWTATSTITSAVAWIQDPLDPKSAASFASLPIAGALHLIRGSLVGGKWGQASNDVLPMGARLPVSSIGTQQAPSGVPLTLGAISAQNATYVSLVNLFKSSGQLVLRGLPAGSHGLDAVAHVRKGEVSPGSVGDMLGSYSTLSISVTQVRPVSTRVVVPWWTYDQVTALVVSQVGAGATYSAVLAAQPSGKTYTQWMANPGVAS